MKVIVAKHCGFCFGVKRATQIAFEAAEKASGNTYSLGPIIHSPQVVERLEKMGVKVLQDTSELKEGTVIIRSHGVTESEMEKISQQGLELVDATCPFVKKAQGFVKLLSDSGYDVVVVGDPDHPEVEGLLSYAKGRVFVVSSVSAAAALPQLHKIGIVAQTTQSFENFRSIVSECLNKGSEIRVFDTICDATTVRQDEAKELAASVDVMIVIGGVNSANTRRLAEICHSIQPGTHHVESVDQLDPAWFSIGDIVGVTAGASTPKWLIDEVVSRIKGINGDKKD
jgi:4-hydroxy-3-methylbut-2-enyl diphosphate reductase